MVGEARDRRGIRALEHEADYLSHKLLSRLGRSIALPFDCDEAQELASALEDVVDYVDEAAERVVIYKVGAAPTHAIELAGLIRESTRELVAEPALLADPAGLGEGTKRIEALETQTRRALRAGLASLFARETDASLLLRWKDIFESLANAADTGCETRRRSCSSATAFRRWRCTTVGESAVPHPGRSAWSSSISSIVMLSPRPR